MLVKAVARAVVVSALPAQDNNYGGELVSTEY